MSVSFHFYSFLRLMQLSRATLDHAVAPQGGNGCPEKAAAVKGKAHAPHIFTVQPRLVRDLQLVPATDLRPAGKAGLHIIGTVFIPLRQQILLIPEGRPGTNNAHVAPKNIPELRNLVKGCLAQEFSNARDVLLRVFQQVRRRVVGRGHLHAAEFIELEIFFMDTHPLLRKEHRAGVIDLDGNHNEQI